jgi:hypothetical protein
MSKRTATLGRRAGGRTRRGPRAEARLRGHHSALTARLTQIPWVRGRMFKTV